MILARVRLLIAVLPRCVTPADTSFDVGWSVSPRPTRACAWRGSASNNDDERRNTFGLSIEPPASTTVAARNTRISPVSVLRVTSPKWLPWSCTSST
jgi:hypothetical protein